MTSLNLSSESEAQSEITHTCTHTNNNMHTSLTSPLGLMESGSESCHLRGCSAGCSADCSADCCKARKWCEAVNHYGIGWLMVHIHFILCYLRKRLMWVISWIRDFNPSISYCVNCHEIFAPAHKKHSVTYMHCINRPPCITWAISFTNRTFYRDPQENHSLFVVRLLLLGRTSCKDPTRSRPCNKCTQQQSKLCGACQYVKYVHVGPHSGRSPVLYMQLSSDNTRGGYITWTMLKIRLLIIHERITGASLSHQINQEGMLKRSLTVITIQKKQC